MFQIHFKSLNLSEKILLWIYVFIPLFAFSYKYIIGNDVTKFFYDIILLALLFIALINVSMAKLRTGSMRNKKSSLIFYLGFCMIFWLLLQFYINISINEEVGRVFYAAPFIIEFKLVVYLLVIGFFLTSTKPPRIQFFINVSIYLSLFVIIDFFVRYLFVGGNIRPSVISEANYDGLLILLGLCALFTTKNDAGFFVKYFLFSLATLATLSKTGLGCLLIISAIKFFKVKYFKYFLLLLPLAVMAIFLVAFRVGQIESIDKIDRFVMWVSFFELFEKSTLLQSVIGFQPGYPVKSFDSNMYWFILNQTEPLGAKGLHAFNYHSFWLRIFTTYGVLVGISVFIHFFFLSICSAKYRYFAVLVLFQGFSMGLFYISVAVIPLLFYYCSLDSFDTNGPV